MPLIFWSRCVGLNFKGMAAAQIKKNNRCHSYKRPIDLSLTCWKIWETDTKTMHRFHSKYMLKTFFLRKYERNKNIKSGNSVYVGRICSSFSSIICTLIYFMIHWHACFMLIFWLNMMQIHIGLYMVIVSDQLILAVGNRSYPGLCAIFTMISHIYVA